MPKYPNGCKVTTKNSESCKANEINLLCNEGISQIYISSELTIHEVVHDSNVFHLYASSSLGYGICPYCGHVSSQVHSRYSRTIYDLSILGERVVLHLEVRKFFCHNEDCRMKTFAEQPGDEVFRYRRRTCRCERVLCLHHANTLGGRFASVLRAAHEKTGRRAVVLIDEYDKPMLDVLELDYYVTDSEGNRIKLEDYNRNVLKGFYGVFKDADKDLQFVLLTGVTKFSQVSVFSGFNQPDDLSTQRKYEALCGITKDELLTVFDSSIRELAEELELSYEETVEQLKKKYDGYHFSKKLTDIFNPFSLLKCFNSLELNDYWFASGTPEYLVRLLAKNDEHINELVGKYYDAEQFVEYKANSEQPLPMIYQSGYLTIKDYDKRRNTFLLDFPNEEVRMGFVNALATGYFKENNSPKSWLMETSDALETGDTGKFKKLMTSLLASATYRFQRKQDLEACERYFQYTFYLIVQMLGFYNAVAEKETSEGRIDCVVECPKYVYILEFKLNGSADAALQQVKDKDYAAPYAADQRTVVGIGINFSSEKGTIDGFKSEIFH